MPASSTNGRSPAVLGLAALVVGLGAGIGVAAARSDLLDAIASVIEPLGTLWVNAIRMILVPLVVSLLITSVTSFADVRSLGWLGARTVTWFLLLLAGAAIFAALAGPPLLSGLAIPAEASAALRAQGLSSSPTTLPELPTLRGFIVGLVPTNPIHAAADGAMLPLIVFTLLFALATTRLPADGRALITGFFRAISQAMLLIVQWILRLTPIGVFALALGMGKDLGLAAAGAVGYYVLVLSAMLMALTLGVYPVVALVTRRSPWRFARAAAPAQAVAAGTRSSLASLPAMIESARASFGDRPGVSGFVLPLAVSTFKLNTPISDLVGPLFLAQLYGIHLAPSQIAVMTLVTIAMSFSNPGIPSGGLFVVTAPVMMSAGLPLDGIGLLIAADSIPDVFATVANVTGDMGVAAMVADAPREPLLAFHDNF
ncbi:MAG TPA: dicarboxylate/amino acid:cation symporter [Vicinamibacterales bacterium]